MRRLHASAWLCCMLLSMACSTLLHAACDFAEQGGGRVSGIADARTIRLEDGREVRLAGVEIPGKDIAGIDALAGLIGGRDISLRAQDDTPDRYGRQQAFVVLKGADTPVQFSLLARGTAMVSPEVADKACSAAMLAYEDTARTARRGIWAGSIALKNAEKPDDILTAAGRFAVVEGKVLSARLAGATFYINFGRRWTRGFAVTISRRMMASFEAAGIDLKSLQNKRIRVRGWVEKQGGPRIEASRTGQIELIAAADGAARNIVPEDEGK